jgi:manganese/zinc/iron transport system permease protein
MGIYQAVVNPYFDTTFFQWFSVLFHRLISLDYETLYPDEIQLIVMGAFSISASVLGALLVLKRLTMMANALSHTILLGIVASFIVASYFAITIDDLPPDWLLNVATLLVAILTCVMIEKLTVVYGIKEDASNGMVFSALFALAITLLCLWSKNTYAGPELLMGDPEALEQRDISSVALNTLITLLLVWVLSRGFTLAIFDPAFSVVSGFRPELFSRVLLLLVVFSVTSAFRAIGFIITVSFFAIPPLCARMWTHRLSSLFFLAAGFSVITVIVTLAASRHLLTVYDVPTSVSAFAATSLFLCYITCLFAKLLFTKFRAYA